MSKDNLLEDLVSWERSIYFSSISSTVCIFFFAFVENVTFGQTKLGKKRRGKV